MIRSITAGMGLTVSGGTISYPYVNMNNPSAGLTRFNGNTQNLEIYDGSSWVTMYSSAATINLEPWLQKVLTWAQEKMAQEQRLQELAAKYPGVADLQQKLDIMVALVQEQEKTV